MVWTRMALSFALLIAAAGLAFLYVDTGSHSASDTLRPLLFTMLPLWALAIAAARFLVRRR